MPELPDVTVYIECLRPRVVEQPLERAPVQRIVYAENETNYCARCQTGGNVLADRALSQLLKKDWPETLDEWEALRGGD